MARAWEQALDDAPAPHTRKVKMRTAMVMAAGSGGAMHALLRHVRLGFGRFGDGRQYMSWIHEHDFVRAIAWLIAREEIEGVVNVAAPNPIPNREFLDVIRDAWGSATPLAMPASGWLLELGAFLIRTEPELVLKSRRVVPARLLESGFTFDFPAWPEAARDLCEETRGWHQERIW